MSGRPGARVAVALTVLVVMVLAGAGGAGAVAGEAGPPAPTTPLSVPAPAEPPRASGPHFTGRAEPSTTQRVVDSLIWVWLLGVLIAGTGAWFWTGRSGPATAPDSQN